MPSVWLFGCKKGLSQGTCGKYKKDPNSRGASQRMGGCASCAHRTPAGRDIPTDVGVPSWYNQHVALQNPDQGMA